MIMINSEIVLHGLINDLTKCTIHSVINHNTNTKTSANNTHTAYFQISIATNSYLLIIRLHKHTTLTYTVYQKNCMNLYEYIQERYMYTLVDKKYQLLVTKALNSMAASA